MLKYPDVKVSPLGQDGNVFFMIGRTRQALKQYGVSPEEIGRFTEEAPSADYDQAIQTIMERVATN